MTITIHSHKPNAPEINQDLLFLAIRKTLEAQGKIDVDVTLMLTDDIEMRQLNQTYRDFDQTTDVLAFNQNYIDPETGQYYLGDIIVSVDSAQRQALENDQTLLDELMLLAIHGTLHLLGFDHADSQQKDVMWEVQEKILRNSKQNFQEEL